MNIITPKRNFSLLSNYLLEESFSKSQEKEHRFILHQKYRMTFIMRKCDIWSYGLILYIMLCSYPSFSEDTDEEIYAYGSKGIFNLDERVWSEISIDAN